LAAACWLQRLLLLVLLVAAVLPLPLGLLLLPLLLPCASQEQHTWQASVQELLLLLLLAHI
jgi:hypothetical protein